MPRQTADRPKTTNWLAAFISISSAIGVLLAMLGYGVALSAESRFGIPHAVIFNATSDLFSLGGWAVAQGVIHLDKLMTWSFYVEIWRFVFPVTLRVLGSVGGLTVVGTVLLFGGRWVGRLVARQPWWKDYASRMRIASHNRSWIVRAAMISLIVVWTLVGTPVALALGVILIVVLCAALAVVPVIGMEAGKAHIDDWVIRPSTCVPIATRDERLQARPPVTEKSRRELAANCVAVVRANGSEIRGRVVFATFNALVLYDPATGAVRRVLTSDGIVEIVDHLRPVDGQGEAKDS